MFDVSDGKLLYALNDTPKQWFYSYKSEIWRIKLSLAQNKDYDVSLITYACVQHLCQVAMAGKCMISMMNVTTQTMGNTRKKFLR